MILDLSIGVYIKLKFLFAAPCINDENGFFDFPTWYKFLDSETDQYGACVPKVDLSNGLEPIWLIALALVDILLRVAGLMAVGYIIFGGYVYIRSAGNPEKASAAQDKITNAIIGLVLVFIAVAAVTFLGEKLGG